jgi:hypothetical protein
MAVLLMSSLDSEHGGGNSSDSSSSRSCSSNGGTISDGEGTEEARVSRVKHQGQMENYWDMSSEQEQYYTEQFLTLQPDLANLVGKV